MTAILDGLKVVEVSAFVAAPLGGLTLAQLGAEVIRVDPITGGPDRDRWPLGPSGGSLFWAGLNAAKRSMRVDLRSPEGQEVVARLVAGNGAGGGILLTNLPTGPLLSHAALRERRPDVIRVELLGNADGTSEVDYTVNAAVGFPAATGLRDGGAPVNGVLPAWDVAMGHLAALAILAADRHRLRTGEGSRVRLALSDVAIAVTAALGRLAQGELGQETPPDGNFLYGAFGRDFGTRDGRRVMVVALTRRQWAALKAATGLDAAALGRETGADLDTEGGRFVARVAIARSLEGWFAARDLPEVRTLLSAAGVSWGPYQSFAQLAAEDPRASLANPMLGPVEHPGLGPLRTSASPLEFSSAARRPPGPAPRLGQHTDAILHEIGYGSSEIASLHDRAIVAAAGE